MSLVNPCVAHSEPRPWGLGASALFAGEFMDANHGGFPSTLMPQVAVQRPVNRTLWLRSELGYHDAAFRSRRTRMMPIAMGVRWGDVSSRGIGAYLDVYPALFLYDIEGEFFGSDDLGAPDLARRGAVAGLVTGFGLEFRANRSVLMSYGIRVHRTAEIDDQVGDLNQVGFQIGIDYRPPFGE